jgi:multicomponent Na+:H+ antiporter subunit F
MIWTAAAAGILVSMVLALTRALLGPTVYDRVLAVNTFGTKTVLLLLVIGYLTGRPDWVDLSLVYALINFIGTIAVLKFFEYGDLGRQRGTAGGD